MQRPTVGLAVLVVMTVRFCFGLCTMVVLLLFQKYFTEGTGLLRPGPTGIAEVLAVGALGVFGGAVVTAPVVRRLGRTRWLVVLLSLAAVIVLGVGGLFTIWSTLITTFAVGFAYQSSKVCMDSVVQADSDDAYRGSGVRPVRHRQQPVATCWPSAWACSSSRRRAMAWAR